MHEFIKDHEVKGKAGSLLLLYVQPGASKTAWRGGFASTPVRLKLSVSASPTEGEANEMVVRFIAGELGIAQNRVHILSGETSRQKNIWLEGIDALSVSIRLDVNSEN